MTDAVATRRDVSLAIAAGLAVAGLTTYGYLVLSARALGAERYAPLAVLWALSVLVGPGLFLPVEQEVSRAIAHRTAAGEGARPLVQRAGVLCALAVVAAGLLSAALWPVLLNELFDGQVVLLFSLLLVTAATAAAYLLRGVFAGTRRFRRYGLGLAGEGMARMFGAGLLWSLAVHRAGPYGLALGIGTLVSVLIVLPRREPFTEPGPPAPWAELSLALGWLVAGSLLSQFLVNAGPLVVKLLASAQEQEAASRFQTGLVLARVPLFFFSAVLAPLLPRLTNLAATGREAEFKAGVRKLTIALVAVGVAMTLGAALAGPAVMRLVFGERFALRAVDLAALAASSAGYMLALVYASALLALSRHSSVALGWLAGSAVSMAALAVIPGLIVRVELSFLIGTATTVAVFGTLVSLRWERPQPLRSGPRGHR